MSYPYKERGFGPAALGDNPSPRTPALSLIQPWAHAITHLGKRIENRTAWRACKHRGPIWLHASATAGKAFHDCAIGLRDALYSQDLALKWDAFNDKHLGVRLVNDAPRWTPRETIPMGAIVGHAAIVDVIRDDRDFLRWRNDARTADQNRSRASQHTWWFGGFALVLDDVTPIEPVTCKGALGLWTVPGEVEAKAIAVLRKAKMPVLFDCGCSRVKVQADRCDVYAPDGAERRV